jgi:crotonobetainyl-CoA:carnitine CoA-transferase CaiB-like acyl-CoA transferase
MSAATTSTLRGIRVLDLSSLVAGPYCAMSLADWGADVIKVEPLGGEPSRHVGPARPGGLTATALAMNRNKRSVELDFHDPRSIEAILGLARDSDVLVHNLLPGLMARMGLSETRLREANERLVIIQITAFGGGPDSDRPGLDPVFQAATGLMSVTGDPDGPPLRVGAPIIDAAAGMLAASAALLGLMQRTLTGVGTTSTISMVEVSLALQTANLGNYFFHGEQPARIGNASHFTLTDCYRTRDGSLVISVISDRAWRDLCDLLKVPDLDPEAYLTNTTRLRHRDHLHEVIEGALRTQDTDHWVQVLHDRRVPYAPVQGYAEAIDYAESQNGDYLLRTHDDGDEIVTLANPVRLTGYPGDTPTHAPRLGQHTEEVLSALSLPNGETSSGRISQ